MNQSAGFANMRPEDKQNSRNAYQTNTGALFQNYDKSERDQWLLTGS
jgi:hypothetical protein